MNKINEAIRYADFPRSVSLIKKYLTGKIGKVYSYPVPEVFHPASGGTMTGIKLFVHSDQAIRLNWAKGGVQNLISMDFWDGSKIPQPYPSHHIKFDETQSLAKALPFIVDFVNGKIDRSGEAVYVNEEVSVYERPLVTDFTKVQQIYEASYNSGELHKTVSNIINALSQGIQIGDQSKVGAKHYGPRWLEAVKEIKTQHADLFTKEGVKHVISIGDVKKINAAKILAAISGNSATAMSYSVSSGTKETTEVEGAADADVERMSYEESLDALKTGVKLLISNATNGIFLAGRGGVGKTATVEAVLKENGKTDGDGYFKIAGSASPAGMYRLLYEHKNDIILFDDADSSLNDAEGRNLIKAAADTSKRRKISWMKGGKNYVDPADFDEESEDDTLPRFFDFTGKIIFISNLSMNKLDPDGALRTRAYVINIDPENDEIYDFMLKICDKIMLDVDYPLSKADRQEVVEILKSRKVMNKTANLRQMIRGLNTRAGIESQGGSKEEWVKFVKLFA